MNVSTLKIITAVLGLTAPVTMSKQSGFYLGRGVGYGKSELSGLPNVLCTIL